MPAINFASTERVAVAWLASIGIPYAGTIVPDETSSWASTGFVQVIKTGGVVEPHVKIRSNVITCDIWAVRTPDKTGPRVPWRQANEIGEAIVDACYDDSKSNVSLDLGGIPVKVLSVWLISDPSRGPSEDDMRAHFLMDFQITWVQETA